MSIKICVGFLETWSGVTLDEWGAADEVRSVVDGYKRDYEATSQMCADTAQRLQDAESDLQGKLADQQSRLQSMQAIQSKLMHLYQAKRSIASKIESSRMVRRRTGVMHYEIKTIDMLSKTPKETSTWEPMMLEAHDGVLQLQLQDKTTHALVNTKVTLTANETVTLKRLKRPKHVRYAFKLQLQEQDKSDASEYTFGAADQVTLSAWVECFQENSVFDPLNESLQEQQIKELDTHIAKQNDESTNAEEHFNSIQDGVLAADRKEREAKLTRDAALAEEEAASDKYNSFIARHEQWLLEEQRLQALRSHYERQVVQDAEINARKEADKIAREQMTMGMNDKWEKASKLAHKKSNSSTESYDGFGGKKKYFGRFSSDGGLTDRYAFLKGSNDWSFDVGGSQDRQKKAGRSMQNSWDGPASHDFSAITGNYAALRAFGNNVLTERQKEGFSTIDKIIFLHSTPMFSLLDLRQILRVAQIAEQVNLPEQTALFLEGDVGHAVYLVISGQLMLKVGGVDTKPILPGEHVGEESLLTATKRLGTAVTTEPTVVLCIFHEDMDRLFMRHLVDQSEFYVQLGSLLIDTLRETYLQLDGVLADDESDDLLFQTERAGWSCAYPSIVVDH
eukprot:SAG11_NODE_174_length_13505_cov_9.126585_9_plen_621_part_00